MTVLERPIIKVNQLQKSYGATEIIKGIKFTVNRGELFAFLGTNGAGKSTTISILSTLQQQFAGEIFIDKWKLGADNDIIRKKIGVVFQDNRLDDSLTVNENIFLKGNLYGLRDKEIRENYAFLHAFLQLKEIGNKRYGLLSGGQRRRADIAQSIIHLPEILFLDEPTTGLDPETRVFVWRAIKQLKLETNMTIFLTTHYMEEAAMADNIVVLHRGEIVTEGTPDTLKKAYTRDTLTIVSQSQDDVAAILEAHAYPYKWQKETFDIQLKDTLEAYPILDLLEDKIDSFEVKNGSMEDVFMQIVDRQREGVSCKP